MKNVVKSIVFFACVGVLCSCNDAQPSDESSTEFETTYNAQKSLLMKVDYIPAVFMLLYVIATQEQYVSEK